MEIQRPHQLTLRQRWALLGLLALFFLFFASISFVNHYFFRTFGWDLGYFTAAIFDYSEGRLNEYDLYNTGLRFTLGDHFEPILFLIAPFQPIFGQYTLLLVQILAILSGGYGAFVYVRTRTDNPWLPHLALIHFLSIWGITSALAFDYHNNVVGAMFLPWFLHYFQKEKFRTALLFLLLLCMSKENMALWGIFLGLGIGLANWRSRKKVLAAMGMTVFAGVYFVWVMKVVLPYYQPEGFEYVHFKYKALGSGLREALETIVTRPLYAFELLYTNHIPENPALDGLKIELYRMMLWSGGLAFLIRPHYLVMSLPIIGQKVFSDKAGAWGINNHYSIELVPLLSIAVCEVLIRIRQRPFRMALGVLVAGVTLFATLNSFWHRDPIFLRTDNLNVFSASHWQSNGYNHETVYEALTYIPEGDSVCASSRVVPHVATRECTHMFPFIGAADYVIHVDDGTNFPEPPEDHFRALDYLQADTNWQVIFEKENVRLWEKVNQK